MAGRQWRDPRTETRHCPRSVEERRRHRTRSRAEFVDIHRSFCGLQSNHPLSQKSCVAGRDWNANWFLGESQGSNRTDRIFKSDPAFNLFGYAEFNLSQIEISLHYSTAV